MNLKTWAPLAVALVLGLCAMIVAKNVLSHNNTEAPLSGAKVLVARNDLPAGAAITAADLQASNVAGAVPPSGTFADASELEGRVVTAPVSKGMPIIEPILAAKKTGSGLQALIPAGMRAITIDINEITGVAGNLVPQCHVDVVSTITGEDHEMMTRTIVENIVVQSIGTRAQAEAGAPVKSVTLIGKPKEAEAIELAAATGRVRLVLRSGGDTTPADSDGITVAELRHGSKMASDPFAVQDAFGPSTQPSVTPIAFNGGGSTTKPTAFATERKIQIFRAGIESSSTVAVPPAKTEEAKPVVVPAGNTDAKVITSAATEMNEDLNDDYND